MISDYDSDDCDIDDNINDEIICDFIDDNSPNDTNGVHTVGPLNIPSGMEEQALRFSLPLEAIKWNNEQIFKLAEMYNKKFNVHKYIWSYETKDKEDKEYNPHLHCYLILPSQARSTKSDYITKVLNPFIRRDIKNRLMHTTEKEVLKLKSYQAYIVKDGHFITNFTDEEIKEIQEYDKKIKEDINTKAYHKLYNRIKIIKDDINNKDFFDLNHICHLIIKIYIEEWDKPPPYYKLKEYALYIGWKLNVVKAKDPKLIFWE